MQLSLLEWENNHLKKSTLQWSTKSLIFKSLTEVIYLRIIKGRIFEIQGILME